MSEQLTLPGVAGHVDDADLRTSGLGRRTWALVTALAAAASGGWTFFSILPAGPVNDDFTNLSFVASAESVSDTFFTPVFFTQISPGHRLLTALQLEVGPLDRIVMHALIAGLIAMATVFGSLIMRRLYGRQPWAPIVMALALASPAAINTNLWYAAAYHQAPSITLGLASILAYLRYSDDRRRRFWLACSVLCMALGLTFSIRIGLVIVVLMLLEHVLLRQQDAAATMQHLWARRGTWVWYLVPLIVYVYLDQRFGSSPSPGDVGVIIESVLRGYIEVFAPLLLGMARFSAQSDVAIVSGALIALSHVVILTVGTIAVLRRHDAARGLAAAATVMFIGLAVSTAARSVPFGVNASLALRYHMDPLVYAVPFLAWGFRAGATRGSGGIVGVLAGWPGRIVTTLAIAGVMVATVVSGRVQVDSAAGPGSARWLEAIQTTLEEQPDEVRSLDVPLATDVLRAFPGRRLQEVDFLFPDLAVVSSLPADVVTASGDIEPAVPVELFRQGGADLLTNTLIAPGGAATAVDDALCTSTSMTLDLVLAPHPLPRFAQVTLDGGAQLRMSFANSSGGSTAPDATVTREPRQPPAVLPMDLFGDVAVARLQVDAVAGGQVCVEALAFLALDNQLAATPLGPGAANG